MEQAGTAWESTERPCGAAAQNEGKKGRKESNEKERRMEGKEDRNKRKGRTYKVMGRDRSIERKDPVLPCN